MKTMILRPPQCLGLALALPSLTAREVRSGSHSSPNSLVWLPRRRCRAPPRSRRRRMGRRCTSILRSRTTEPGCSPRIKATANRIIETMTRERPAPVPAFLVQVPIFLLNSSGPGLPCPGFFLAIPLRPAPVPESARHDFRRLGLSACVNSRGPALFAARGHITSTHA